MRVFAFALALVAVTSVARADDDDEDGDFVPMKTLSVAVAIGGHSTRIGGQSETGLGPSLELAYGRGRWQYIIEGGFATATLSEPEVGGNEPVTTSGRMLHGDLGLRWLARQFRPDSIGGVELLLLSALGVQRYYLGDATRLTRPELAFGFGIQGRLYRRPRIAFRLDMRVLFTPNDREGDVVACRGRCMTEAGASTGFSTGIGFAW